MRLPQSRLARIGLALLPWLPLAFLVALVWSQFPATEWVTVEKMRLDQPSIYYSQWEQAEQQYPGFRIFFVFFVVAILAFLVGLVCLTVAAFVSRRPLSDATPTI
jgi:hypothetical protein